MINLIKFCFGAMLFSLGIAHETPGVFSMFLTLAGCYCISRPLALDTSGPAYFLIGIIPFIPCYFLLESIVTKTGLQLSGDDLSNVRLLVCLLSGVFSLLSVPKK